MSFLLVDKIQDFIPRKEIRGIKYLRPDEPYRFKNEVGKDCFISTLIGEALGQLAAWNVMFCNDFSKRPVAGVVSNARIFRSVELGETLLLESFIDSLDETAVLYHSVARVQDEVVFSLDGALGPLLPMSDFIDGCVVREQFENIQKHRSELSLNPKPMVSEMQFDRIDSIDPKIQLTAYKRIPLNAPYFPDHFPKKPVLPMTILLECKQNLVRTFLSLSDFKPPYRVRGMRKIKMNRFVAPGDELICKLHLKHRSTPTTVWSATSNSCSRPLIRPAGTFSPRRGEGDIEENKLFRSANEITLALQSEVNGQRVCVVDIDVTCGVDS